MDTKASSHNLRRFGGGVSRGLEEVLDELSVLCLVGLFGALFGPSRFDSDSLRSFFTTTTVKKSQSIVKTFSFKLKSNMKKQYLARLDLLCPLIVPLQLFSVPFSHP